jgi:hypothetical protein
VVEDCQQQRTALRLRTVFMITGIGVHDPPESAPRTDGSLSGYRWGVQRKRALIEREAAPARMTA